MVDGLNTLHEYLSGPGLKKEADPFIVGPEVLTAAIVKSSIF
jgi:hypothetical protein